MIDAVSNGFTGSATVSQKPATKNFSSDFETFLKMLTTQARYQDPLEPIDSSEYAGQLAQFSMVEQQVQTNNLLESLGTSLGAGPMSDLVNWVGRNVRSAAPVFFDGSPVEFSVPDTGYTDQTFLVISDSNGLEVQRKQVQHGATEMTWRGYDTDGALVTPGLYTAQFEREQTDGNTTRTPAEHFSIVREARIENDNVHLILSGGQVILTDEVSALRLVE